MFERLEEECRVASTVMLVLIQFWSSLRKALYMGGWLRLIRFRPVSFKKIGTKQSDRSAQRSPPVPLLYSNKTISNSSPILCRLSFLVGIFLKLVVYLLSRPMGCSTVLPMLVSLRALFPRSEKGDHHFLIFYCMFFTSCRLWHYISVDYWVWLMFNVDCGDSIIQRRSSLSIVPLTWT